MANLHFKRPDHEWHVEQEYFDILNDYLQPSSTVSPTTAAQQLNRLFPDNRPALEGEKKEDAGSFLLEFWECITLMVRQIPWEHPSLDRLVELINTLAHLPSERVVIWGTDEMMLWYDLPLLGHTMTEEIHQIGDDDEDRHRWESFHGFAMRLTRDVDPLYDGTYYATLALSLALEEKEPDPRARAYQKLGARLDRLVPVAAEWIRFSGPLLFRHCSKRETAKVHDPDDSDWHYSLQRWRTWKRRFGEIKVHSQAGEETKRWAREAEEIMAKVEKDAKA